MKKGVSANPETALNHPHTDKRAIEYTGNRALAALGVDINDPNDQQYLKNLHMRKSKELSEDISAQRTETAEAKTVEASYNTDEVIELCRNDLNFLAMMALPTVFQYMFPPVFLSAWDWLCTYAHKFRDFSKLALGLPRGFGKTTFIKIFILYCILFTDKKFILVISNSADHAENIISDVIGMLNEPNIKSVFGDWRIGATRDNNAVKQFGYRGRTIILAALGRTSNLRGLNLGNSRPDLIIFEDVQSREQADSKEQSDAIEKWMVGTAGKAKSPHGMLTIFVANMYPTPYSILRKLKTNPTWIKFIAGGILSDGTSLWEELQPITQLVEEYRSDKAAGHPEIFYAEVLNDENATASSIDLNAIPQWELDEFDIPDGSFIIIDPSGDKTKSDNTSIGYFEIHNLKPHCIEIMDEVLTPIETIDKALEIALRRNCFFIACEAVQYQASLLFWFEYICNQRGIHGFEFQPVYPGAKKKQSRIVGMLKRLWAGEILLHPRTRPLIFNEIMQFNQLKTDNVDNNLDVLTYIDAVMTDYADLIVSRTLVNTLDNIAHGVLEHNSPF